MSRLWNRIARRRAKRIAELTHVEAYATPPRGGGSGRRSDREASTAFVGRIVNSYDQMVQERLGQGYEMYLLTFMFAPMCGSAAAVAAEMVGAIEACYVRTRTLVVRHLDTAYDRQNPLIWLCYPDYPVPKRSKQRLRDLVVNEGRHYHVIVLVPPFNRLHRPYDVTVERKRSLFEVGPVCRVHVQHIDRTPSAVVGYGLKQLLRRRCGLDDVVLLPRTKTELPGYVDPRWRAARQQAEAPPVARDPWARHRRAPRTLTDSADHRPERRP